MAGTRRTGFRGDSRSPDEIFITGFNSRDPASPITYGGDIDQNKAVSLSWRMRAATYFPLPDLAKPDKKSDTWLYVVNIDISNANKDEVFSLRANTFTRTKENEPAINDTKNDFVNIHAIQVMDSMKHPENLGKHLPQLFYAEEIATKKIKPQDILFAVRCTRTWNDPMDFEKGGQFILTGDIRVNTNRDQHIPDVMVEMAEKLLIEEMRKSELHPITMPMADTGYAKNTISSSSTAAIAKSVSTDLQITCIDIDAQADTVEKHSNDTAEKPESIQQSPTNKRKHK